MSLNKTSRSITQATAAGFAGAMVVALFLALTGCGGGGGSSAQADQDLQYSGVTTPAVIDAANADQLVGEALAAGGTGTSLSTLEAAQVNATASLSRLRSVNLPMLLKHVVVASAPGGAPLLMNGTLIRHTGTLTDNCPGPGYVTYDKSYDDATGDFNATYWFSDFCDKGALINGRVTASGTIDTVTEALLTYTLRFRKLTDGAATLSGSLAIDATGSPVSVVFNALIRDEATGRIYWIKDYTLVITEYSDYLTVDISGTFYNPDHGFIRLSTDALLEIANSDEHPRAGAIVIEGAGGAEVKLTAIDNMTCRVEADTDGNGIYDVVIDSIGWDDL